AGWCTLLLARRSVAPAYSPPTTPKSVKSRMCHHRFPSRQPHRPTCTSAAARSRAPSSHLQPTDRRLLLTTYERRQTRRTSVRPAMRRRQPPPSSVPVDATTTRRMHSRAVGAKTASTIT
ncbi:hypothetical protein GGF42_001155, partial [Coemansia sp. RSA 2424]